jgi:hypothetical protein
MATELNLDSEDVMKIDRFGVEKTDVILVINIDKKLILLRNKINFIK